MSSSSRSPDLVTARVSIALARAWALGRLTDVCLLLEDRPHHLALAVIHLGGGRAGVRLLRQELRRHPIEALVFRTQHNWGPDRGCQAMHDEGGGWIRYFAGRLALSRWILTRTRKSPR